MSVKTVCRLCLSVNSPVRALDDGRLWGVYEKLTNISWNTPHRPLVACLLCRAQLWKCYNLMVRSLRADEVLSQILRRGKVVTEDSIVIINCKTYQVNDLLSFTPVELISVPSSEHSLMQVKIKEEQLQSQIKEEIHMNGIDSSMHVDNLKYEESEKEVCFDRAGLGNGEDSESGISTVERDVKIEELEGAVDIDNEGWASERDIEAALLENLNMENEELPDKEGTKRDKLEGVGDIERSDMKNEVSDSAEVTESSDSEGQSREQHTPEKLRTVKETESPNTTSTDVSASTETAAVMVEVSRNTSRCSDTATHRGNVSVDSENESTTAGTDVGDSRGEHLTDTYVCNDCGDIFDDKHILIQHVVRHDTGKRKNIQKSGEGGAQKCTVSDVVNKHLKTDTDGYRLECGVCQQRFSAKVTLNEHLRIHTEENLFECAICRRTFNKKSYLNRHLRIHTKEKPFRCGICKRRFTEKGNLNKHLRIHTENKLLECAVCQRTFIKKDNLDRHLRIHTKEKPFECKICQRRFSEKGNLNKHLSIHTEEKPFECEICERKFIYKSKLNIHLRIHTKEKPFECTICQRRFGHKSSLTVHSRTQHGVPPQNRT